MNTKSKSSLIRTVSTVAFLVVCLGLAVRGVQVRASSKEASAGVDPATLDFTIQETAKSRGLSFKHIPPNINVDTPWLPYMQTVGMSIAVSDVNDDGFMDLYLTNTNVGEPNRLFVNDGHGRFSEQGEKYGLAHINREGVSLRSFFFDCDNDGQKEAVVMTHTCPVFLKKNSSGRFETMPTKFPAESCGMATAVAVADLDANQTSDLIIGGLGLDFMRGKVMPSNVVESADGSPLQVLLNDGQCNFSNTPQVLDFPDQYFFHSIGVGHFTGKEDGRPDVWVATDFSGDKVFLNKDDHYEFQTFRGTPSRSGMNSEVMYLDGDQPPYIFVSHVYHRGYITGGNTLWQYDGERFRDHAIPRGLHECGWAWAGRAVDLNNDGLLDLAVANGFISGDPKKDYWYPYGVMVGTSNMVMSRPDLWVDMRGKTLSGHQRDCLYLNRGTHFQDIAASVGFDDERQDGRAIAVVDAENDGRQQLVVGNQNGELKFYTITPKNLNGWVGVSLESRKGNREALGAIVTVRAGAKVFRRQNFNLNTYESQSDPRLHFGLGALQKVDSIEVRWPSGRIQNLGALPINRYHHIVEE